jgi:hypothetical protein
MTASRCEVAPGDGCAVRRTATGPSFGQFGRPGFERLVREAGSCFRVHWRLRRLSGCARHRLPSCYSSTAWTACTPGLGPTSNRVCEQKTAPAGFVQALCPSEEGLHKPGKDFRHAVPGCSDRAPHDWDGPSRMDECLTQGPPPEKLCFDVAHGGLCVAATPPPAAP